MLWVGRCVRSTRRDRRSETILWTPLAQGKEERTAPAFLGIYLDVLDEELLALPISVSMHKPSSTMIKVEELSGES